MKRQVMFAFLLICALLCSCTHVSALPAPTQKYFIFRDDDVSSDNQIGLLEAVNQIHIEENVPVTLGIIPHPNSTATGNELLKPESFLTYMRSIASNSLFEFAQHGYTHQNSGYSPFPSEFCTEPYPLQLNAIKKGQGDIQEAFGVRPTTFIPPFNEGDENTLKAAEALGFTEYSAGLSDINMLKSHGGATTVDAESLDISGKDLPTIKSLTEKLLTDTYDGNTLVIMYHIWSFKDVSGSADSLNLAVLRDYIQYLKNRGDVLFTRSDRSYTTAGSDTVAQTSLATASNVLSARAQASGESTTRALAYRQETQPIFLPVGLIAVLSLAPMLYVRRRR